METIKLMENLIYKNYELILKDIQNICLKANKDPNNVEVIAICKRQPFHKIEQSIKVGIDHFGENRVQEASQRWIDRRLAYSDLTLHLIGPLQTNKAAEAVAVFDVIEVVDREKIARVLAKEMARQNRHLPCYIQVNTGEEPQKSGISPNDLSSFVDFCQKEVGLPITGLMCIPPMDEEAAIHFGFLNTLASRNNLTGLSMGMSGDYEEAIRFGATHIRVGSALFGSRE